MRLLQSSDQGLLNLPVCCENSSLTGIRSTTFSMPANAYMDLGWAGLILPFWYGAAIGAVFARLRRFELWALAVYPLCLVGILDSYRITYWTTTQMVVPLVAIALVMRVTYRVSHEETSRSQPHPLHTQTI